MRKEFNEIDANHDNYISQEELYYYLDKKVIDFKLFGKNFNFHKLLKISLEENLIETLLINYLKKWIKIEIIK